MSSIFGLHAARVYGVDPEAKRNPMPSDYLEKLRTTYQQSVAESSDKGPNYFFLEVLVVVVFSESTQRWGSSSMSSGIAGR